VRELIMEASTFIKTKALLWPLFYSGAFYLLFCGLLSVAFNALEKKLDYIKV
jgi:polar amino acid transport system permease protein